MYSESQQARNNQNYSAQIICEYLLLIIPLLPLPLRTFGFRKRSSTRIRVFKRPHYWKNSKLFRKIRGAKFEWRILRYNEYYAKFGTIVASNAYVLHTHESSHFHHYGSGSFLLVEAPPQSPQDTILYPENAAKMQRLRDSSNRLWTFNVHLSRVLFPWYAYPPRESCLHLPWRFAENASHLWPFGNPHTWLFSQTEAGYIPLAGS